MTLQIKTCSSVAGLLVMSVLPGASAAEFPTIAKTVVKAGAANPFYLSLAEITNSKPGRNFQMYLINRDATQVAELAEASQNFESIRNHHAYADLSDRNK